MLREERARAAEAMEEGMVVVMAVVATVVVMAVALEVD